MSEKLGENKLNEMAEKAMNARMKSMSDIVIPIDEYQKLIAIARELNANEERVGYVARAIGMLEFIAYSPKFHDQKNIVYKCLYEFEKMRRETSDIK